MKEFVELPVGGLNLVKVLTDIETGLIDQALYRSGGSRVKAAHLLCIGRSTLIAKMKKLCLMEKDYGQFLIKPRNNSKVSNKQRDKRCEAV